MRKLLTILFLLGTSLLFSQEIKFSKQEKQWIKEHPIVEFGYEPNWPPYDFFEDGKYSGLCSDYFQLISKSSKIKFVPKPNMDWSNSLAQAQKGEILMLSCAGETPERAKSLLFSDAYFEVPMVVAMQKDAKVFSHLSQFNNKTLSLPRNYLQVELIKRDFPKIKLILRDNLEECLMDVSSNKAIATVESIGAVSYFMNNRGFSDLKIAFYTHYQGNTLGFAFPKNELILQSIVNKCLKKIDFAKRNEIQKKWIKIDNHQNEKNKKLFRYLLISLAVIIIGFTIFYLWNKSLRKKILIIKEIELELKSSFEKINKQNNDKTILLQEIHHRVKNNLQIVISMLRLQANAQNNEEIQAAFSDAIDRINSISLIHEHLYKSPDLTDFSLKDYILNLCSELKHVFITNKEVEFEVNTSGINLEMKPIIPIALILNELLTNSFKYGLVNSKDAKINIDLFKKDGNLHLNYSDNGVWFHNESSSNFGTYLIEIFTEQLDGSFERINSPYANYEFIFKSF